MVLFLTFLPVEGIPKLLFLDLKLGLLLEFIELQHDFFCVFWGFFED